jgi:hypothetical protein
VIEGRKRLNSTKMDAIAQTLDGTETFETKKELFDYALSELFSLKHPRYTAKGISRLQIGTYEIEVEDFEIEFSI